jgi:Trk K+ transport system NAD-binding subunit
VIYTVAFHYLMESEGREYSWADSIYWTLTVMSTLGFGDITFTSDIGRIFTVLVLLSGIAFFLVMLPFTFIEFFYAPWLEARKQARTPRQLPRDTRNHVIMANSGAVAGAFIRKLRQYDYTYAILLNDQQRALDLHDQGYRVVIGDLDARQTYERIRADRAALVLFNQNDQLNTNAIYTLRSYSSETPVVASADSEASVDIMELAGADQVFDFSDMLGRYLARRVLGVSARANIIGEFEQLAIAEAPAMRSPLEGQTLEESDIRETTGVNVIGIWKRGGFSVPRPDTRIGPHSVLVLAGSREQLSHYNRHYGVHTPSNHPVLIVGAGRVGMAAADHLREHDIDHRIVERQPVDEKRRDYQVLGDAAELDVLKEAGIENAPSVIITTNDDDMNIYLTIYCRKLRPDMQIIARSTKDRSIATLHHAGADLVMSYASIGANAVLNFLRGYQELLVTEGLNVFSLAVPKRLSGKTLQASRIRERTGCSVVALRSYEDMIFNPDPSHKLRRGEQLILIGRADAPKEFAMRRHAPRP